MMRVMLKKNHSSWSSSNKKKEYFKCFLKKKSHFSIFLINWMLLFGSFRKQNLIVFDFSNGYVSFVDVYDTSFFTTTIGSILSFGTAEKKIIQKKNTWKIDQPYYWKCGMKWNEKKHENKNTRENYRIIKYEQTNKANEWTNAKTIWPI